MRVVFYGGLSGLLLFSILADPSPGITTQIARNSEAYLFALLLAVDRDRVSVSTTWGALGWWVVLAAAVAVTGPLADDLGIPGSVATLGEAVMAGLILSIALRVDGLAPARLAAPLRVSLIAVVLVIVVVGELLTASSVAPSVAGWIVGNAETWAFVLLGGVWAHVFCAGTPSVGFRISWYVGLVAIPVVGSAVNPHGVDSSAAEGFLELALVWLQRVTEAFVAVLALSAYADLTRLARSRRSPARSTTA